MPRASQDHTAFVPIIRRTSWRFVTSESWLKYLLIDDSIQFLAGEQMIVPVEHNRYTIFHQQLVNRHRPAGPVCGEAIAAIGIGASLFVKPCLFRSSALPVRAANQMMKEDHLEFRFAVFEYAL